MAENHAKLQGVVKIRVKEDVTLDQLHALLGHIGGLCGCETCGLMGIDLQLSGDPVAFRQIAKLPGVKAASFGE
jgi:hypothetical protein